MEGITNHPTRNVVKVSEDIIESWIRWGISQLPILKIVGSGHQLLLT